MSSLSKARALESHARLLGIALIVGMDGRLKAFPTRVARKYPKFLSELMEHQEGLKACLLDLAR